MALFLLQSFLAQPSTPNAPIYLVTRLERLPQSRHLSLRPGHHNLVQIFQAPQVAPLPAPPVSSSQAEGAMGALPVRALACLPLAEPPGDGVAQLPPPDPGQQGVLAHSSAAAAAAAALVLFPPPPHVNGESAAGAALGAGADSGGFVGLPSSSNDYAVPVSMVLGEGMGEGSGMEPTAMPPAPLLDAATLGAIFQDDA